MGRLAQPHCGEWRTNDDYRRDSESLRSRLDLARDGLELPPGPRRDARCGRTRSWTGRRRPCSSARCSAPSLKFEKATLVAKLKAARERKKRETGKCGGRKSLAEVSSRLSRSPGNCRAKEPYAARSRRTSRAKAVAASHSCDDEANRGAFCLLSRNGGGPKSPAVEFCVVNAGRPGAQGAAVTRRSRGSPPRAAHQARIRHAFQLNHVGRQYRHSDSGVASSRSGQIASATCALPPASL